MVIGMIGAFLFILIQLVLLVDFAHAWNERWLGNYEEHQSRIWFTGTTLLFCSYFIAHYVNLVPVALFKLEYWSADRWIPVQCFCLIPVWASCLHA